MGPMPLSFGQTLFVDTDEHPEEPHRSETLKRFFLRELGFQGQKHIPGICTRNKIYNVKLLGLFNCNNHFARIS